MLNLDFYNRTAAKFGKKLFASLLPRAEQMLVKDGRISGRRVFYVELTLMGDKEITRLNFLYRQKNKPTDVISLSYFDRAIKDSFAGEIFISSAFARKQAKKLGHSFRRELQFLFIHGLLHVFGYRHDKLAEEKDMEKLTTRILDWSGCRDLVTRLVPLSGTRARPRLGKPSLKACLRHSNPG